MPIINARNDLKWIPLQKPVRIINVLPRQNMRPKLPPYSSPSWLSWLSAWQGYVARDTEKRQLQAYVSLDLNADAVVVPG
jgi:hypothetical protein